jgi:hypothetical protein
VVKLPQLHSMPIELNFILSAFMTYLKHLLPLYFVCYIKLAMISNNYPCLTHSPKPTMNGENSNEIELERSVLYVDSPLPSLVLSTFLYFLSLLVSGAP